MRQNNLVLFLALIICIIVKKLVTINKKENTANILLSITFLHTQSHFIVLHFTMKSLPIIVFSLRWRMLEDSFSFELSSLVPWKGKDKFPKKRAISKRHQSITLLGALIFRSSMFVLKIGKKIWKTKIVVLFIYSSYILLYILLIFLYYDITAALDLSRSLA